jgi:hypothetical protein
MTLHLASYVALLPLHSSDMRLPPLLYSSHLLNRFYPQLFPNHLPISASPTRRNCLSSRSRQNCGGQSPPTATYPSITAMTLTNQSSSLSGMAKPLAMSLLHSPIHAPTFTYGILLVTHPSSLKISSSGPMLMSALVNPSLPSSSHTGTASI